MRVASVDITRLRLQWWTLLSHRSYSILENTTCLPTSRCCLSLSGEAKLNITVPKREKTPWRWSIRGEYTKSIHQINPLCFFLFRNRNGALSKAKFERGAAGNKTGMQKKESLTMKKFAAPDKNSTVSVRLVKKDDFFALSRFVWASLFFYINYSSTHMKTL